MPELGEGRATKRRPGAAVGGLRSPTPAPCSTTAPCSACGARAADIRRRRRACRGARSATPRWRRNVRRHRSGVDVDGRRDPGGGAAPAVRARLPRPRRRPAGARAPRRPRRRPAGGAAADHRHRPGRPGRGGRGMNERQPMLWGVGTTDYCSLPQRRVESLAWDAVAEAVRTRMCRRRRSTPSSSAPCSARPASPRACSAASASPVFRCDGGERVRQRDDGVPRGRQGRAGRPVRRVLALGVEKMSTFAARSCPRRPTGGPLRAGDARDLRAAAPRYRPVRARPSSSPPCR